MQLCGRQAYWRHQYQAEIGQDIFVAGQKKKHHRIDILMENMGRVNYGHKFLADTQRKGDSDGRLQGFALAKLTAVSTRWKYRKTSIFQKMAA